MARIKIIEIELSELNEIILAILERYPGGISADRLRYILIGKEIPLSAYQMRKILSEMTTLRLLERQKRSRSYLYSLSASDHLKHKI